MSGGGPPHQPHNRHVVPPTNTAWNHLQVPNYYARQLQHHAHIPPEHSLLSQPTWHTPSTADPMKILPHSHTHSHMLEMLKNEGLFPRDCVDLSLTRNGNQNGELPATPISLSVRDTNKINSLPASVLEIQTKCTSPGLTIRATSMSPGLKSLSPGRKSLSPGPKSTSPGVGGAPGLEPGKAPKRSNIRVDSILERLNPMQDKAVPPQESQPFTMTASSSLEKPPQSQSSVIVQAASNFDENSNSSGTTNIPTPTNPKEDDSGSLHSNEDSLDSTKSRRKRKPSKTVRVNKDDEVKMELEKAPPEDFPPQNHKDGSAKAAPPQSDPVTIATILEGGGKASENRQSTDELDSLISAKTRRKGSSESETIDDIAAMVREGLKEKERKEEEDGEVLVKKVQPGMGGALTQPVTVSVIKTKENLEETLSSTSEPPAAAASNTTSSSSSSIISTPLVTPAQKKAASITHFVEVENKLEEMFAGIVEDHVETPKVEPSKNDCSLGLTDDSLLKLDEPPARKPNDESVKEETVKILEDGPKAKKVKKSRPSSQRDSDHDGESPPKKKRFTKTKNSLPKKPSKSPPAAAAAPLIQSKASKKALVPKPPLKPLGAEVKDVYAYDSGSNASSSKSKGPFVQIRGPRDSPLSVSVINAPLAGDEESDKKPSKAKKFHDDSEYRHKVRSKGLHCSTLSNKYDAERKDATWICAFCKRGPHANELTGPSVINEIPPPGDLFGPYFITGQCPEFEKRLDDPYDRNFKSRKITKALDAVATKPKKTSKRTSLSESADPLLGITDRGNHSYEVWVHENCLVWSPGVYLVGPKLAGLEEAVWKCSNMTCTGCALKGANVFCLRRGCLEASHLSCARKSTWQLDETGFRAFCPLHAR